MSGTPVNDGGKERRTGGEVKERREKKPRRSPLFPFTHLRGLPSSVPSAGNRHASFPSVTLCLRRRAPFGRALRGVRMTEGMSRGSYRFGSSRLTVASSPHLIRSA